MPDIWEQYIRYRTGTSDTPAHVVRDGQHYLWLGCCVTHITYDFPTRTGVAYLLPGHCTDHLSVVRYFRQIDPQVRRIETWAGTDPDAVYVLDGDTMRGLDARPRKQETQDEGHDNDSEGVTP